MDWNLKGGVIIIGSLLWQEYLHKPGDKIRFNWRNDYLDLESRIQVKVPIRYGRVSTKSGSGIITMVFSNKMKRKLGFGYVVPLNRRIHSTDEMLAVSNALCNAEGMKDKFHTNWGALGYMINKSRVEKDVTKSIKKMFKEKVTEPLDTNNYKVGREKSCISNTLELSIPWIAPVSANDQFKMNDFDFLLGTATQPTSSQPSIQEITRLIKADNDRRYFLNNIKNGIVTHEDFNISKHL
jgi:hypothetical protein